MQVALADGQSKLEETLQQEIPLLEFCKNSQREQTMPTMSTQHASAVGMSYGLNTLGPLCLWQCF